MEGCVMLKVCQADFNDEEKAFCPPQLKNFAILVGATSNGHVLIFGRGGIIVDRYQMHIGAIMHMNFDEERRLLITAGVDDYIRIAMINPLHPDIIQIKIEIPLNFSPRMLCVMGSLIAASADDATIHMFEINLQRKGWRIMGGHPKVHDHTQKVKAICCSNSLGIFMSIGNDNSLRIWSHENKLLREIQFQETLDSVCLANDQGDLLLGIGNRIDLIMSSIYLPPAYLKYVKKFKKTVPEAPMAFNDNLIPYTRAETFQIKDPEKVGLDKSNPFEVFCVTNLTWFDKASNISRKEAYSQRSKSKPIDLMTYEIDMVLSNMALQMRRTQHAKSTLGESQNVFKERKRSVLPSLPSFPKPVNLDIPTASLMKGVNDSAEDAKETSTAQCLIRY